MIEKLINIYKNVNTNEVLKNIGKPYRYYYADTTVQANLFAKDLMDVDIKSAYPTFCRILYGEDHEFVKKINSFESKLEKNKYISITLKQLKEQNGIDYIDQLTILCKLMIFSYVYSKYNNINVLEYNKDGIIIDFNGYIENEYTNEINKIIKDNNIIFHEDKIQYYFRINNTSIIKYINNDKLKIKGNYNGLPLFLQECILKFLNGDIYDNNILSKLNQIYDNNCYQLYQLTGSKDQIDYYYKFEKGKILENPRMYLTEIIFPILGLLRSMKDHF